MSKCNVTIEVFFKTEIKVDSSLSGVRDSGHCQGFILVDSLINLRSFQDVNPRTIRIIRVQSSEGTFRRRPTSTTCEARRLTREKVRRRTEIEQIHHNHCADCDADASVSRCEASVSVTERDQWVACTCETCCTLRSLISLSQRHLQRYWEALELGQCQTALVQKHTERERERERERDGPAEPSLAAPLRSSDKARPEELSRKWLHFLSPSAVFSPPTRAASTNAVFCQSAFIGVNLPRYCREEN
ncbi:hypothetical protein JOB18_047974 [Solea senegalensis]|uniref:Uncharacterized protein n=1 Tax=Solea senegalensis TaxID=28829 RepID=A0AAV6Q303_SOLSE|nr:hypothetical protein JOB18_047974 [Solea senegalensis]